MTATVPELRCQCCDHLVEPNGNDWRCRQGCTCTMRGCTLGDEARRLVAQRKAVRVNAAQITPECRASRGDEDAWNEAVARMRLEYDAICGGWVNKPAQPTLILALEMRRP